MMLVFICFYISSVQNHLVLLLLTWNLPFSPVDVIFLWFFFSWMVVPVFFRNYSILRIKEFWWYIFDQRVSLSKTVNLSLNELRKIVSAFKFLFCPDTPSQRVQFILGTEDDDEEHIPHDLFTEMDELCYRDGEEYEWKETAR